MIGASSPEKKSLGVKGEDHAVTFLKKLRYSIIERNYRCKGGEIDIIAKDGNVVVFVEVKTRKTATYGPPQLSVTPFKQRQISKAALTYLVRYRLMDANARFDVIGVYLLDGSPVVEHIKDAFDLAY